MSRSDDQRLADMLDCAAELAHVVSHGHQAFIDDPILRRAAERLLEIIGEAAGTLSKTTRSAYPDVAWRDISRLRIVIAHHYTGSIPTRCGSSPPLSCRRLRPG